MKQTRSHRPEPRRESYGAADEGRHGETLVGARAAGSTVVFEDQLVLERGRGTEAQRFDSSSVAGLATGFDSRPVAFQYELILEPFEVMDARRELKLAGQRGGER